MTRIFLAIVATLVVLSACNREIKAGPTTGNRFPTDTSMIQHENPANKSSTSVGIGME
jgi:hypothetical protein